MTFELLFVFIIPETKISISNVSLLINESKVLQMNWQKNVKPTSNSQKNPNFHIPPQKNTQKHQKYPIIELREKFKILQHCEVQCQVAE